MMNPRIVMFFLVFALALAIVAGLASLVLNQATRRYAIATLGILLGLATFLFLGTSVVLRPVHREMFEDGKHTSTFIDILSSVETLPVASKPATEPSRDNGLVDLEASGNSRAMPPLESKAAESKPIESKSDASASANSTPVESPPPAVEKTPPEKVPATTTVPIELPPEWLAAVAHREGAVYRTTAKSGLYVTRLECDRALDGAMQKVVNQYIDDYLGLDASQLVDISPGYIKRQIQKADYTELVNSSVGPMHQVHARLEFDDSVRAYLAERWHEALVVARLWRVGSGAALVLSVLLALFGYLKLDLLTSGSYRPRLQLAAVAAILLGVAGALLIQSQAWR